MRLPAPIFTPLTLSSVRLPTAEVLSASSFSHESAPETLRFPTCELSHSATEGLKNLSLIFTDSLFTSQSVSINLDEPEKLIVYTTAPSSDVSFVMRFIIATGITGRCRTISPSTWTPASLPSGLTNDSLRVSPSGSRRT